MGCTGKRCGWARTKTSLDCVTGTGGCALATLLEADISDFHDQALADATTEIRAILNSLPADPKGRKLSFIHTDMGTILAWVTHDENAPVSTGAITAEHADAEVASALGLKNVPTTKTAAY